MPPSRLCHAIGRGNGPIEGECDALFAWWSIAKTVLAAAVLRLADSGRLSLDAPFRDRRFTIRQLLQHTAGLNTYGGAAYQRAVAAGDPVWPVADMLARVKSDQLIFAPGDGWAYSNVGYLFIRQVIEEATGTHLDSALRALVFAPMGIERSRIATTPADLAATHWGNASGYDPNWVYHGLLIGPPADAVCFLRGLNSGVFLSPDSALAMRRAHEIGGPIAGRPWQRTGYGLGLMMGTMDRSGSVYGHSGASHESVCVLYCFADLPDRPIVAAFARGPNEGVAEFAALALALGR